MSANVIGAGSIRPERDTIKNASARATAIREAFPDDSLDLPSAIAVIKTVLAAVKDSDLPDVTTAETPTGAVLTVADSQMTYAVRLPSETTGGWRSDAVNHAIELEAVHRAERAYWNDEGTD